MILANGKLFESEKSDEVISRLKDELPKTIAQPPLDPMVVVSACGALSESISSGAYTVMISQLIDTGIILPGQLESAISHMSRESLLFKLETELIAPIDGINPPNHPSFVSRRRIPLGVLMHISAGNMDGLPAYSVIEGLLAGNINLLKLPSADNGLSILMLSELVRFEPRLAPYVYVFDTPSTDFETLSKLAEISDAITIWGSDDTISALRKSAPITAKLIEWGHKRSFAYATSRGVTDEALEQLAVHIFNTNQVLCSSCQGIYLDTENPEELEAFAVRMLEALDKAGEIHSRIPQTMRGRLTLELRCAELEPENPARRIAKGKYGSVIMCTDPKPETSMMFGVCWVKMMPKNKIIETLFPHRGYMQTVGLMCAEDERKELADVFAKSGAVRITGAGEMSRSFSGEAHDGEFPLLRYTRVIEY